MDALIVAAAYISAWGIKFGFDSLNGKVGGVGVSSMYVYALLYVVPGFVILYAIFNLYTPNSTLHP